MDFHLGEHLIEPKVQFMIDYIRYLNNSFGRGSGHKFQEMIPIRDLDTENKRLKQIVEVQKGSYSACVAYLVRVFCTLRGGQTMTHSLLTLLADPDYAQLVLLRDYLFSIAAAASSQANALELAEPWNLTGINGLRQKRDYLRHTALAGALRV
jgi:hypothetical protein